jgi:hypothetical protein
MKPQRPDDKRIGNEFWKIRSRHGREKLFKTPELMWEAACEYFQWCADNPLYEYKGFAFQGEVTIEAFPLLRALTMEGLCFYLHCSSNYFKTFKAQLTEFDDDFMSIIHQIEKVVYRQKFEGAAAGLLNANIIARDLGLVDKGETNHKGIVNITIDSDDAKL